MLEARDFDATFGHGDATWKVWNIGPMAGEGYWTQNAVAFASGFKARQLDRGPDNPRPLIRQQRPSQASLTSEVIAAAPSNR